MKAETQIFRVLQRIAHAGAAGVVNSEIAADPTVHDDASSVAVYTGALHEKGLIECAADIEHPRRNRYTINAIGRAAIAKSGATPATPKAQPKPKLREVAATPPP